MASKSILTCSRGAKAGNLRLASKRMSRMVAPLKRIKISATSGILSRATLVATKERPQNKMVPAMAR